MNILISHTNFPSQFRRLIPIWLGAGHDICFIAKNKEWHSISYDGLRILPYQRSRDVENPYTHPYLRRLESAVLEGQAAFRKAKADPLRRGRIRIQLDTMYPSCCALPREFTRHYRFLRRT